MGINRSVPIKACSFSLRDAAQLYQQLQVSVDRAAEMHISSIAQPSDVSDENFQTFIERLRNSYKISIVINGMNGETLIETGESIFTSPNLPSYVTGIYFDSNSVFKADNGYEPPNWFFLQFDFRKPLLMDWQNPVSSPTPNGSEIKVVGQDQVWVAGVFETVNGRTESRSKNRNWLHMAFVYDLGLWLIGLPLGFAVSHSAMPYGEVWFGDSPVLQAAFHVYLFFMFLTLYRLLFGYTKWTFPKLELVENNDSSTGHRLWWGGVMASAVAGLIILAVQ